MAAKRRIKLKVIGKEYPMTIQQNEEEKFRRAAQDLIALISAYKTRFVAEPEDYLAMAAIQIAADKVGLEMDRKLSDEEKALSELEQEIDDYLNKI